VDPKVTVYGAYWCPDCHRSKNFLGEHQIPYGWIDIEEDAEGERFVIEANDGKRRIPTLVFDDGDVLTNPSNAELAAKLGLKTTAERHHYDLIVVGGGPAGLTAALYAAREGIDTLVIERAAFGGQAAATVHLDNVPGFVDGITGQELSGRFRAQAERFGVELLQAQDVVGLGRGETGHRITTDDGTQYTARAVLIAAGTKYRRLGAPGEEEYLGAGIHFCATCDGPFYKGRSVAVIGGGNSASEESLFLTRFADHVTLLVRGKELTASHIIAEKVLEHPQIDVRFHTEVDGFVGSDSKLKEIRVRDAETGEISTLDLPGAFIFIGLDPNTGWLKEGAVDLDEYGFIKTGHALVHDGDRPLGYETREPNLLETSVPGVFAAGDVRIQSTKQVASAAGEGAAATLMIREYLKEG